MRIQARNIIVIGESMLDKYIVGDVRRISPEAPVPVLKVSRTRNVPGGAANVASNLAAASQNVSILSLVGFDDAGEQLRRALREMGVNCNFLLNTDRPTITKTRYIAESNQQVLRVDEEDCSPIAESDALKILQILNDNISGFDMLVVSDYLKGMLTYSLLQEIIGIAKSRNIPVFVDAKDPNFEKYIGATLLKPNLLELRAMTGMPTKTNQDVIDASMKLIDKCSSDYVLTTMGSKGMVLVDSDAEAEHVDTTAREVFDVSGAGDTSIAYLSAFFANGFSVSEAMKYANVAAGLQVSKAGTSSVYLHEVQRAMSASIDGPELSGKMVSEDDLPFIRKNYADLSIVFTNGCFDIIHLGHVNYLKKASMLGDILVVGVNSDASVSEIKGDSRPINNEFDRAALLASFDFVDHVVIFNEDTPYDVIQALQPDVLVKGGDYSIDEIVGRDIVDKRGGKVLTVPYLEGKSTSAIIDKISEMN